MQHWRSQWHAGASRGKHSFFWKWRETEKRSPVSGSETFFID
jgi:hypothetical protein